MNELIRMTARQAVAALASRQVSPAELIDAAAERIAAVEPMVNALPTLCLDRARAAAEKLVPPDPAPPGYLHGLPVAIKDLVEVQGVRTTWGSRAFEKHVSQRSDYSVERLERNGGIVIAKANTPEFGAGAQTFNEVFGTTTNPWNTALTPAGSSGGSAVAVATGEVWLADGSDLGGSLRIPASFTGIVGLRPSPGRVAWGPRTLPFDTLSVLGPMGRNVGDCALMLDAQVGADHRDPLSLPRPETSFVEAVDRALTAGRLPSRFAGGCRIGWTPDLGLSPVDAEVVEICAAAVKRLEKLGAKVSDETPDFTGAEESFQVLRAANFAASVWPRIEGKQDLVKPEVIWNAEKGLKLGGPEIAEARRVQGAITNRLIGYFERHDFLLLPTAVSPPFDHRIRYLEELGGRKFDTYISWLVLTFAITLTGTPAISIPAGFTRSGLPVGLQVVARPRGEAELLAFCALLESDLGLAARVPVDPVAGSAS
ncbi:MAG TPA: amidase family protein [Ferrovibrio sp.]|uniref:amidase n=1 Tax=Ferrovibrio sp. TaxID=1917215 RepID=UPI002B4B5A9E|nr:amidase family protein [Ferrovibrio sp.]HLT76900.1 amidase family protein [Ferrovibrio sp.]